MFEDRTEEKILQEMLEETDPKFDTSETSPIYAAHAASAKKQAEFYINLNRVLELGFASTSEGEYLEKRTSEVGLYYNIATPSIRRGHFNISVPEGARFIAGEVFFTVTEAGLTAELTCETAGVIGNELPDNTDLVPFETIPGLQIAKLGEVLIPGTDEETSDSLYSRFQRKVSQPSASGNKSHYLEWISEIPSVGAARLIQGWNGLNTIKVIIVNNQHQPASAELVQFVQNVLDPNPGQGEGTAPFGHFVTVESAAAVTINIAATVEIDTTETNLETVTIQFESLLDEYLQSISFRDDADPIVREKFIGGLLMDLNGVEDYSGLTLNGTAANITITDTQIAVRGTVVLSV